MYTYTHIVCITSAASHPTAQEAQTNLAQDKGGPSDCL